MNSAPIKALSLLLSIAFSEGATAGEASVGTGFFYNSSGHLFTNKHVISACLPGTIRVRTNDQIWHPARILAIDSSVDIAALSIDHGVEAFASFPLIPGTKSVLVPSEIEDAFSAGFSSPEKSKFKLQYKWGQIQPWKNPNKFPYVNRMRMDAYRGASGSPILDYAGLLIGIVFAGSVSPVNDYDNMKTIGYGDKWIYAYNNNALLMFANKYSLQYSAWDKWERKDPVFIWRHTDHITALIVCQN